MYIHEYIHIYIYTYHQNVREFALGLPILFKRVDTDFAILCNVRVEDRRDEKALGRGCREIRTKDELHSEAASLKRCLSCASKKKSDKQFKGLLHAEKPGPKTSFILKQPPSKGVSAVCPKNQKATKILKGLLHSSLKRCLSCVSKKKKATTNLMGYCTHRNQGR